MDLTILLLGSPHIERDGQPIEIPLRKALALLAFLAVGEQSYSRDTLASFFWPDYSQSRARSYLRNALWVLKGALGESAFEVLREEVSLRQGSSLLVDVACFQGYLKAANVHQLSHTMEQGCQSCLDSLAKAVELYRDDFLSGFTLRDCAPFDEWQDYQCEDLRQQYGSALERLALLHGAQGHDSAAIAFGRRLVLLDPFNEKARRILMEGYFRAGRRPDALRQYQDYAQVIRRELDITPSTEITELYNAMRTGSVALSDRRPPKIAESAGRPKGEQRLGGRAAATSSRVMPILVTPIAPPPPVPCVGREQQLAILETLLQESVTGHGQSLFVSGVPGSGKLTLVTEFSRRAQETYAHLIVASGTGRAQHGPREPFSLFKDVLSVLAGEIEQRWAGGMLTAENLTRLFAFLPTVLQTLIDHAPYLLPTLLPELDVSSKVWGFRNRTGRTATVLVKLLLQNIGTKETQTLTLNRVFDQYEKTLQVLSLRQPLLLVLIDLQWADPSSIFLLSHLRQRIRDSRIMIVGTYSSDYVNSEGGQQELPFSRFMSALEAGNRSLIDLDQVGSSEGRQFVDAYLTLEPNRVGERFRQALWRVTGGQPMLLSEYIQEIKENGHLLRDAEGYWVDSAAFYHRADQPVRLEALIKARISRLPERIRAVLATASAEGIDFSIETIASILNMDNRELIQLITGHPGVRRLVGPLSLYHAGPERLSWFRFRHHLYHTCFYSQLSYRERVHLHEAIAARMANIHGEHTDQIANVLAWHFQEAENTEKAVYFLEKAGRQANHLGANLEAAELFRLALNLLESLPDTRENEERVLELTRALSTFENLADLYCPGYLLHPSRFGGMGDNCS